MCFADFRANFYVFLTIVLFCWLKWVLRNPFYLSKLMITIGYSFVGKNHFFVERNFFVHVRHFKAVFFHLFWLRGLVMILF